MSITSLRDQLIRDEGWVREAYPDPLTHGAPFTIGVGHTGPEVHQGLQWTDNQVSAQLDADIAHATDGTLRALPWVVTLDPIRAAVLFNMAFQMGVAGLLEFKHMLAATRDGHYEDAANEMLTSTWAKQTAGRAHRLARQMQTAQWQ
jgi:lysozyme